jgi:hypothetical protein
VSDGNITGELSFSFTDEDGQLRTFTTDFDVEGGLSVSRETAPIADSGEGIEGCWSNSPVDAWCFYSNGTGQYIQYSVNGNPGTMFITFSYTVDYSSNTITSRNTYIELVGSCCDKSESLNSSSESASFEINGSTLSLGNRDYIYTSSNLGN